MNKAEVFTKLCKLLALPPFDGMNPCAHDGIYAKRITLEYGKSIDELSDIVGISLYVNNVDSLREQAIRLYDNKVENLGDTF